MISSGLDTQNTERESSSVFTAELVSRVFCPWHLLLSVPPLSLY